MSYADKRFYKRSTATAALEMIKERISMANANPDFIYNIDKAVLFGSYLNSEDNMISHIEIAIYISPREKNEFEALLNIKRANAVGVNVPFIYKCIYGKEEICKFIKNKKNIIALYDGDSAEEGTALENKECFIYSGKYEVIYQHERGMDSLEEVN
jgi:predicted nucleotidyltransferase